MAHNNNNNNNNKNNKHNSIPRYIPLPKSLWELRHRFPTVTRCVMLQCVRCHRWVAQPVTHSIPDVVQTCATTTTTTHKEEKTQQQQQHEEQEKHESQQHVKEESKDEWRSPRLRQHYEKVVDAGKSTRQEKHNESQEEELSYFIPNPANFKCQWIYCDLGDVWTDLREQWLGELYVAMVGAKNDEENNVGGVSSNGNNNNNSSSSGGSNKGIRQRGLPHSQQERLNEELTKELHGRRSERLAKRPHNGIDIKYENSDGYDNAAEPSHSGRITQHVNNLIHQDEAVLASFCWISCDQCGKLRRVHQPFPGGAPFVCELALNIGSCDVPENEGLSSVFRGDSARSSVDDKMEHHNLGDLVLRDSVETEASVALTAASTGRRASKVVTVGKRPSRRGSFSLESTLPLLRQLTTALRKRALGAFVKNLMIIPQEVRAKREEVGRSSLLIAEDGSRTDSNSPKRDSGGSIQRGVQNNNNNNDNNNNNNNNNSGGGGGRGSSSTPTHTPIKQQQQQEEEERERERENEEERLQKEEEHYRSSKGGKKQTSEAFQSESPRPTRRLGCPPRHAKWELREDVNSHRISLVVNPSMESLDGVSHHKEISPLLLTQQQQHQQEEEEEEKKEEKHYNKTVKTETILKSTGVGDVSCNGSNKQIRNSMDKEEKIKQPLPPITVVPPAEVGFEKMSIHEEHHTGSSRGIVDRKRKKQTLLDDYQNSNHGSVSTNSPRGSSPLDKDYNNTTNEKKKKVKKEGKKQQQKDDVEIIHWVCCDVCNKWRIVPQKIPEGTEKWQCVMRGDGTNCSDTDDEIRMNRSEKERKTRGRPRKARCEYPICTSEDLLMTTVTCGTTENAFVYDLEDMLNLDTSVPCYSGTEVVEESIVVSDKILELPMPPEARKLALKAVVESHRFQEQLDSAETTHASTEERRGANDPLNASLHSSAYGISEATEETNERVEFTTGQASSNDGASGSPTQSFPRFGRVQETRVDLICVKEDVLMGGLVRCTKDRVANSATSLQMTEKRNSVGGETSSTAATSGDHTTSTNNTNNNNNSGSGDLGGNNTTTTASNNNTTTTTTTTTNTTSNTTTTSIMSRSEASLAQMPPAVVDAVRRPPPPTRWSSHPGNFVVEEAFIKVRRRTKTARYPWFEAYECHGRLECPDCHLGLAYLFIRKAPPTHNNNNTTNSNNSNNTNSGNPNSSNNNNNNNNNSAVMGGEVGEAVSLDEKSLEEAQEPHQKRERKEDESRSDDNSQQTQQQQQQQQQMELNSTIEFPEIFVGLELKRIRQCEWGLRDFQRRYQLAKELKTFRELFPESEELDSLHGRLRALRTQSELYNNLLCKHKEQIDVQSALLKSQKERILTCEEKLRTMQQIIEAQRVQLEMQDRQIKHQEELVRNHKSQVVTQQHQIQVEQLLLSEQSRTIESQREQIALIQDHLRARLVREQLEARCGRLTSLLHQAEEQRLAQTVNNPSNSSVTATHHDSQEEGDGERERERERERESIQTRRTFQQREESLRLDRQPLRVDYSSLASGSERKSELEFGDRPLTNKAVSPSFAASASASASGNNNNNNNNNNNEIRARAACSSSTNSSSSISGSNNSNSNSGDGGSSHVRSTTEHTNPTMRSATEECAQQQRVELSTTVHGNNNSANTIQTTNESERVESILASAYRRRRIHSLSEREEGDNPPK